MTIRSAIPVAGFLLVVAILLLTVHLTANTMEFSRYNTGWNGNSSFFSDLDRHTVSEITLPSQLSSDRGNAMLLIIAPERSPAQAEISAYRMFLSNGNTLVLIDDFGSGNEILRGIGSSIRILPGTLSSVDREYSDPYSIVVYSVTNSTFLEPGESMVLNRAAALEGGKSLLTTSVLSWIDLNGDKRINANEFMGNFAVMAEEKAGNGNIIVLSDPSIFINSMYGAGTTHDNRNVIHRLTGNGGHVLIDQMNSRTADADSTSGLVQIIRSNLGLKILIVFILMLLGIGAWRSRLLQV